MAAGHVETLPERAVPLIFVASRHVVDSDLSAIDEAAGRIGARVLRWRAEEDPASESPLPCSWPGSLPELGRYRTTWLGF
jgi:hypothetical protein